MKTTQRKSMKSKVWQIAVSMLLALTLVGGIGLSAFASELGAVADEAETPEIVTTSGIDELAEPVGESLALSLFGGVVPQQAHTVQFFDGINPEPLELRYVLDGETTTEREHPDFPAGMTAFLGWFTSPQPANTTATPFSFGTAIDADTDFYPGWSDMLLVKFLDFDGIVIGTQQVAPGGTASKPAYTMVFPAGIIGTGEWLLDGVQYNFAAPVTGDIVLTPQVTGALIVQFITKGTAVSPQVIYTGGLAAKPATNPTRPGYTFKHWSDEEGGAEFNFATPITANTLIYAVWTPQTVSYRIAYWLDKVELTIPEMDEPEEKDNHGNYRLDRVVTATALAGSTVTVNTLPAGLNDEKDVLFYSTVWSGESHKIEGDGSTVINVYCLRNIYNLEFNITFQSGYNTSAYKWVYYKNDGSLVEFIGGQTNKYMGSFKVGNFGADPNSLSCSAELKAVFKKVSDDTIVSGTQFPGSWCAGSASGPEFRDPPFTIMKGHVGGSDGKTIQLFYSLFSMQLYHHTIFYETLDGAQPDGVEYVDWFKFSNGKYYRKFNDTYTLNTNTGSLRFLEDTATSPLIPIGITATSWYNSGTGVTMTGFWPIYWNGTSWVSPTNSTDNTQNWVSIRDLKSYPVILELNGGTISSPQYTLASGSTYKSDLYKYTMPLAFLEPDESDLSYGNYTLEGWYSEPNLLEKFDWSTATMGQTTTVYAKWNHYDHAVEYKQGESTLATDLVEDGAVTTPPGDYVPLQSYPGLGTFLGWFLEADGVLVTFDFETLIKSDMTLHAVFAPDGLTLTYVVDPDGKGFNPPIDPYSYYPHGYYQGAEARAERGVDASKPAPYPIYTSGGGVFAGWQLTWDDPEYEGELVYPGRIFLVMANGTLTARYVPKVNAVTLTFHQNKSATDTKKVDENYLKNETAELPEEYEFISPFSNPGFRFLGWSTNPSATAPDTGKTAGSYFLVAADTDLYAVWEEIEYTVTFYDEDGTTVIKTVTAHYGDAVTAPANPTKAAKAQYTYTFAAWVPQGSYTTANLANVQDDMEFVASYTGTLRNYTITVKCVDENGITIESGAHDWTASIGYGEDFSTIPASITGYTYQDWELDGAAKTGSVEIKSVDANHEVVLIYRKNITPTPIEENIEFIKSPNRRTVSPGETVPYTFTGFGNKWGVPLDHYSVSDIPDKGLDFVSASLPAFKNGAGVTYDVLYRTNKKGSTVLHSGVPADKAFSFSAPTLASGEYIVSIGLKFGTVPPEFAMGNSMTFTFKVWDNPPSQTLTNIGILGYTIDGKEYERVTDPAITTISGHFGGGGSPKTGDHDNPLIIGIIFNISLLGMIFVAVTNRKRRKKEAL